MTQGHKAMTHFSTDFKKKVLARLIAGEGQSVIADDLKMSPKTVWNWYALYTAGKLGADGKPVEGVRQSMERKQGTKRVVGEASTDTFPVKKAIKKRTHKKLKKVAAEKPARLEGQTSRSNAVAQVTIQRLERELAYIKADRDILVKALASLTR
jgi:transposase-like protein